MQRLQFFWQLSRANKRIVSVVTDVGIIFIAFHLALLVRLGNIENFSNPTVLGVLVSVAIMTVAVFTRLGLYRAVLRYLTFQALSVITIGAVISALLLAALGFYSGHPFPRTVPIIYGAFLALLCGGARAVIRSLVAKSYAHKSRNVLIYGAGSGGRQLAMALRGSGDYRVRAFIDGDSTLTNTVILGLPVIPMSDVMNMINKHDVSQVLLAVPSAKRSRRKEIIDELSKLLVEIRTVPELTDIVSGKAKIDELKEVPIEDLLGRDPVAPQQVLLEANIKDKVVMVTGAGGSIGSELCRQILLQKPTSIVLFELSEFGLYQIDRELNLLKQEHGLSCDIIPLLGSVQRQHRLETAMKSFKVETVYHAAAYKHVPLVEYNVVEGVRNNIYGTYYTACAAIKAGVESFVLISTDKAVRPTNVMGTTKRMAELGLQALAERENKKPNGTRFCMVRFGNVLGSSGSVIPLFKKQIERGGPVTVTHPEITRFFMTIPEAAQLVIQAGAMGKGGDVFVLDMGEPVKITDLASNLIHLSGLEVKSESNPHGDIEILFAGLRPGEKLYEELLIGDNVKNTSHERIMTAHEVYLPLDEYESLLDELDFACHNMDHVRIRELLLAAPTDFNPTDGISDLVWNQSQVSQTEVNQTELENLTKVDSLVSA
ncbi:polysaccharide biosynthesis protein [Vibrio natriegens]|uniref:Nucleoside-diphosphate sugar epimerase n=1 Tax=Vibrio natriegens NBRC 15636 = ATCC 14048 = DSM 759 TaxID=1219067 RepID=A0AAN0Y068_VIBNA|nr:nucleoside-diphosphate sugar epimerase/dehydratase [Vibrio natriegens]ALR16673.1 nucleoside-diphosphate sugar epimerase [Vibrio natriegens NBRC 15636 = ATCC 14048 = DSM 759]ANQ11461.1 nucleoside-diphosphate sugar epimerase [Vibrio natriegens NBRC 15636 = ATCC 14048 = DSM 759]EPM39027.1 nucleoside-diphosphate sugar epimerase [Vibrio natriegens NBRC 15636 = ATCC 14048 = DSM 759]MDX6025792.1 nucleoside-diphosphate sugar epimerase/dehydratase [Vibrio natriegens NBRC 15636 = ATCC 14048 = DSM 759]